MIERFDGVCAAKKYLGLNGALYFTVTKSKTNEERIAEWRKKWNKYWGIGNG